MLLLSLCDHLAGRASNDDNRAQIMNKWGTRIQTMFPITKSKETVQLNKKQCHQEEEVIRGH